MIDHGYKRLEHKNEAAKTTVVVNWCMTDVCNYNCSYCIPYLHKGNKGQPDYEVVMNFCKKVIEAYSPNKICFEFTGGEITTWKEFKRLIKELKGYPNIAIGIISNGSKNIDYWKTVTQYLDHVCLSYQPEMANKDHYLNVVKLLSQEVRTHVNIMMHPLYFDDGLYIAETISKNIENVSMALQPLLVDFKDELYEYTDDELKILDQQHELYGAKVKWTKEWPVYRGAMNMVYDNKTIATSPQRFISHEENKWKGWKCYAGVEQIVVDLDGRIWRGWCKEGGSLGNINGEVNLNPDPIICNKEFCHCNFDIMCTKERS